MDCDCAYHYCVVISRADGANNHELTIAAMSSMDEKRQTEIQREMNIDQGRTTNQHGLVNKAAVINKSRKISVPIGALALGLMAANLIVSAVVNTLVQVN